MSRKISYVEEPIRAEIVTDYLPPPEQLVMNEDGIKITITLSRNSVEFFKAAAKRNHTSYQRMIRRLLDTCAERCRAKH